MPFRSLAATGLVPSILGVALLLGGAILPAAAHTGTPAPTVDAGATSNTDNPGNTATTDATRDAGASGTPQKPASERLPEPKPSDYGAKSFHAPTDAQLDLFMATHQPPEQGSGQNPNAASTATGDQPGMGDDDTNTTGPSASRQPGNAGTPANSASAAAQSAEELTQ